MSKYKYIGISIYKQLWYLILYKLGALLLIFSCFQLAVIVRMAGKGRWAKWCILGEGKKNE